MHNCAKINRQSKNKVSCCVIACQTLNLLCPYSILERLKVLGYSDADLDSTNDPYSNTNSQYHLNWDSLLNKPHELTERGALISYPYRLYM